MVANTMLANSSSSFNLERDVPLNNLVAKRHLGDKRHRGRGL